jgi:DNA-binding Lrp family transcriptional regulator
MGRREYPGRDSRCNTTIGPNLHFVKNPGPTLERGQLDALSDRPQHRSGGDRDHEHDDAPVNITALIATASTVELAERVDLTPAPCLRRVKRLEADGVILGYTAFEEVIEARRMFGLPDYLLRVATDSLESFETFVSTKLGDVPGVDKLDSHMTMKLIKSPEPRGA